MLKLFDMATTAHEGLWPQQPSKNRANEQMSHLLNKTTTGKHWKHNNPHKEIHHAKAKFENFQPTPHHQVGNHSVKNAFFKTLPRRNLRQGGFEALQIHVLLFQCWAGTKGSEGRYDPGSRSRFHPPITPHRMVEIRKISNN